MKITAEWLKEKNACQSGFDWWKLSKCRTVETTVKKLIASEKLDWANWLVARALSDKNKIRYVIFAAEQVLELFEKKYPEDRRPRIAIEAAKEVLKKNNPETRRAADAAAHAAHAAAYAAATANAAEDAAATAYAAYAAAYAAAHAADAAHDAAAAAYAAYAATKAAMKIKIVEYGLSLIVRQK
jgi:hypothetical protein